MSVNYVHCPRCDVPRREFDKYEPTTPIIPGEAGAIHNVRIVEWPARTALYWAGMLRGFPDELDVVARDEARFLRDSPCWVPVWAYQNWKAHEPDPDEFPDTYSVWVATPEQARRLRDSSECEPAINFITPARDAGCFPARATMRYRGVVVVEKP